MEHETRIELASSAWRAEAQPIYHSCVEAPSDRSRAQGERQGIRTPCYYGSPNGAGDRIRTYADLNRVITSHVHSTALALQHKFSFD